MCHFGKKSQNPSLMVQMTASSWVYILSWIGISCVVILLNKSILSSWNFGYPLFLTSYHMLFATVVTQILSRTTSMLTAVKEKTVSAQIYQQKIIPISLCFAVSLVLGGKAYVYLSVSYIQVGLCHTYSLLIAFLQFI